MGTTSSSENTGTGTMNPALSAAINRPSTAYYPNGGFPRTVNPELVTIPKHRNQTNVSTYVENTPQPRSGSGFTMIDIYPPEKEKDSILDQIIPLTPGYDRKRGIDKYIPDNTEILFSKLKLSYDKQDNFEDFLIKIGGYT